jgi:hypothetical protein
LLVELSRKTEEQPALDLIGRRIRPPAGAD